jgi:alkylation response protein AidB-like acyl-CoA dehydrogenase
MRFGGVPVILGLVVGGLRDIVPWLEQRRAAQGEVLINKSNIQMTLGSFYGELQLVRLLLWRAANLIERSLSCSAETAIAKYKASSLALKATQEFVQLLGWRGLDAEYSAQKRLRDARATAIFEGTNEIMLLHAFRELRRQVHTGGDL